MRFRTNVLFLFLLLTWTVSIAQDVQLSQYYNAPLYLNPALTGTANNTRAIVNYRNQWTALPSPFITYVASFDHYIAPASSGVGVMLQRDQQGDGHLTSTSANLYYSYHVWVSEKLTFIPAVSLGFTNRSVNYSDFIFGDQVSANGISGNPTTDQIVNGPTKNFVDIGSGGLLYSDRFWIGLSGFHLNKPNQAFVGNDKLPIRANFHGGYKFFLEKQSKLPAKYRQNELERSISPTFLYKSQGAYDQLDLGVYATWEPIMFGLWYRGIPIKKYKEGINNNESLVFYVGIKYQGLAFGYSYDLTISSFKPGSGGSHELSLMYQWEIPYKNYKPKKHPRKVSCPSFYR
jgi:type IX secretion system PorP/SprF family membrane protein